MDSLSSESASVLHEVVLYTINRWNHIYCFRGRVLITSDRDSLSDIWAQMDDNGNYKNVDNIPNEGKIGFIHPNYYAGRFTMIGTDNKKFYVFDGLGAKSSYVSTLRRVMGELLYPVGCIYQTFETSNPYYTLGFGTWEMIPNTTWLANNTNISNVNVRGGSSSHSHWVNDHQLTPSEMPNHTHDGYIGLYRGTFPYLPYRGECDNVQLTNYGHSNYYGYLATSAVGGNATHNHGYTSTVSTYPPFITCRIWRRIA